jgi:hypothetical protein
MQNGVASGWRTALAATCGILGAPLARAEPTAAVDPPCMVRLMPPDAASEWRRAASELRHRLRQWPAPDRDCRELLVEVKDDGALLTITTKDGRQARRLVPTPGALVPAASALAVSVETPPPEPSSEARAVGAGAKELERSADRLALLSVAGGLRVGAPGVFWAPVLRGAAALQLDRWELGTFVDWAPEHWLAANDVPPRFTMWSMSTGLAAGRREPLGAVDLLAGLMFGATFVHQKSTTEETDDDTVEIDEEEGDGADLLLGGYLGIATPRHKSARFRAQIEFVLPPSRPGQTRELDSDLPPLPGWSLTALVGAEFGAP